jgi:hypothetical protein
MLGGPHPQILYKLRVLEVNVSKPRKMMAIFLADHVARYRGVVIPDGNQGARLAYLVRGGGTLAPDAYPFTVNGRENLAELSQLPKRR